MLPADKHPVQRPPATEGRPWRDRAGDLAAWAWNRLVNRTDVWGGYHPLHERGRAYMKPDGTAGVLGAPTTRPAPGRRGKEALTPEALRRHFEGRAVEHVVGLHTTGPDSTSRWGAVEVDWHGPDSNSPGLNLAAALHWFGRLRGLGFAPLLTDSNGQGGYHLRFLLSEAAPTPLVFDFLRWLVRDHARHGIPHAPETFPKQPRVEPGRFGNWLRLPGRHHTRDHWSAVYADGEWVEGEEAVAFLLTLRSSPPSLIPADLPAPPRPAAPPARTAAPTSSDLSGRIGAYLRRLPNLAEGQGRDDVAFGFAAWLVRDMALEDAIALDWLCLWDQGNRPPKGRECLAGILANARRYARRPVGCGRETAPPRPSRGRHRLTHMYFSVGL